MILKNPKHASGFLYLLYQIDLRRANYSFINIKKISERITLK